MRTYLFALLLVFTAAASTPMQVHSQGLLLTPGARFIVSGPASIVLQNAGLTNNGRMDLDSSTVLLTGDDPAAHSFVGGRAPLAFYQLVIDRPAAETQLHNDVTVAGSVAMVRGNLQLNSHTLDLGRTGSITGERDDSRITASAGGLIKVLALLNAPGAIDPGNIGLAFTSDAALGWTTITRGHEQTAAGGIRRYFDVAPEQRTTANIALRFRYLDSELDGIQRDSLALFSGDEQCFTSATATHSVEGRSSGLLHRFTLAIRGGKTGGSAVTPLTGSLIRVAPNPSPGTFTLTLVSAQEGDKLVRLYDAGGRLLELKRVHCIAGANSVEWDLAASGQGMYYLAVEGAAPISIGIVKP